MTKEELDQMIAEEEQRLGVGSKGFMKRHMEIMNLIEQAGRSEYCGKTVHNSSGDQ